FNLVLLPVNLAGVLKSIEQSITSKKIPFARTPKIKNRTASPSLYVITPFIIVAFSALTLWRDFSAGNWGNAAFAAFNGILASWAIIANIGVWNSIVDVYVNVTQWLFVEKKPAVVAAPAKPVALPLDWQSVLYHGSLEAQEKISLDSAE